VGSCPALGTVAFTHEALAAVQAGCGLAKLLLVELDQGLEGCYLDLLVSDLLVHDRDDVALLLVIGIRVDTGRAAPFNANPINLDLSSSLSEVWLFFTLLRATSPFFPLGPLAMHRAASVGAFLISRGIAVLAWLACIPLVPQRLSRFRLSSGPAVW